MAASMENNNPVPVREGGSIEKPTGWRLELTPEKRRRVVYRITETLLGLPHAGQVGLLKLRRMATEFEHSTYMTASSKIDYMEIIAATMVVSKHVWGFAEHGSDV
ncbi:hypothetical protein Nepgr_009940 [Nepenthes gracilis]|uniref:Mediator complex subunit 15 KIX domain-containing protein n=1 Tax=Nepenthes gracilis TaxID=150966 RepID=A0AAD3XKV2_NEPGR|nr:hypothetical protein Nepgr_009940 [Nepenthes gracilis]